MDFQAVDRLPVLEWARGGMKTVARWHTEGLDPATPDLIWAMPGKPVA